tara:strand:+ start:1669 stop:2706 length:1038 start_codon:yes stop_codon:yes gene_type:complete
MNSTINNFNPFQTVSGFNQIDELVNFISDKTCVITMEDIWELYKDRFPKHIDVYFVNSLEEVNLDKEINKFKNYTMLIGFGGGQAIDIAKYFSWKNDTKLFQFPTSVSVDAVFGHRSGIRRNGIVNYVGWAIPECVFIDYEIICSAPKIYNYSGIGDVLCFYTGVLDWQYANEKNKCEKKWPYNKNLSAISLSYVDDLLLNKNNIRDLNNKGVDTIIKAHQWGGNSFFSSGWNPRHIEGIEHFFFYNLEFITKQKFIHGQPVCLGFILGCLMHNKYDEKFAKFFKDMDFDIRPEAMNITWESVMETLLTLNEFILSNKLWYGIGSDKFDVNETFNNLKESVNKIY